MAVVSKFVILGLLLPSLSHGAIRGASSHEADEEPLWLLTERSDRQLMGDACPNPGVSVDPRVLLYFKKLMLSNYPRDIHHDQTHF